MKINSRILAPYALAVALCPASAFAQAAPDAAQQTPTAAASSDQGIQEIIVTAQRRAQTLMSVPLSIQAQTGQQLQDAGIKNLTSLQFNTPGLLPSTNSGFTQIFLRGIGNSIYTGADPSVALFVDDVPQIYGQQIEDLVDVDRIEILKGAQGGLYGRNATAGAINIVTRKPSTKAFSSDLRVSYGERNTLEASGYVNVPISDSVAFSISAYRSSHDSYVKNIAPKTPFSAANFPNGSFVGTAAQTADFFNAQQTVPDLDKADVTSFHGKLLIDLTPTFSTILAANYTKKGGDEGTQYVNTTPAYTQGAIQSFFGAFGITTNFPPGLIQGNLGKFVASVGHNTFNNNTDYSFSNTATWNAPGFDLTSISAYRHAAAKNQTDGDSSTITAIAIPTASTKHYFYQELRASSTFDGPLHLIGGATYLKNHIDNSSIVYLLTDALPPIASSISSQNITNWSIYGQAAYDFTKRLSLTASLRYQHEQNDLLFTSPVIDYSRTVEHAFTPSATLSYKTNGGNVYVRWARGFKNGGVNTIVAPVYFPKPTDGSVFGPEKVDTYEAGFKGTSFDRKVQVTGAVFYNDYRNLQALAFPNPNFPNILTADINAKSARTYGAEGSVNWRVAAPLTVGTNFGYLNAKYKDFKISGSSVLTSFDYSGRQMIKAPKWQVSFNADLDQPISDRLSLTGNLLASYTTKTIIQYTSSANILPDAVNPAFWLVNARIGIKTANDKYKVFVAADNLLNQVYYVEGNASSQVTLLNYGIRRIIRVGLEAKF